MKAQRAVVSNTKQGESQSPITSPTFPSTHYPSPSSPPYHAEIVSTVNAVLAEAASHPIPPLRCYRHTSAQHRAESTATFEELTKQVIKLPQSTRSDVETLWSIFARSTACTRLLILGGLLNQCCVPQLSFVRQAVPPLLRVDFIAMSPPNVAFKILSYLDAKTLCRAAQVSKVWQLMANDDRLWHRMCEQHIDRKCTKCGWGLPLLHKRQRRCEVPDHALVSTNPAPVIQGTTFTSACAPTDLSHGVTSPTALMIPKRPTDAVGLSGDAPHTKKARTNYHPVDGDGAKQLGAGRRPWKQIYAERLMVERHWRQGQYRLRVLEGHTDGVLCLQFDDQYLISGSYDSTVKVWNLDTGTVIRTLEGHTMCIRALQFDQVKLITGSMDDTIKIWNYRTGQCLRTLTVGCRGVNCLHFDSTLLASGGIDGSISAWNFKTGDTVRLTGHTDWVNGVRLMGQSRLLSCSDDTTLRLWDLNTRSCLREFIGHVGHVQTFQLLPHPWKLPVALSRENSASPPSGREEGSPTHMTTLAGMVDFAGGSELSNPRSGHHRKRSLPTTKAFITGGLDSTLKVWSLDTGDCLATYFGHAEGIWSLATDSLRTVSASNDSTIKVWDLESGKCLHTFSGNGEPINCVALGDTKIISGSMDRKIRIWDFSPSETQPSG
ncbi:hypothetical protein IWQ61_004840 [Dispira simplex]|nr:hypothetical protein IWQ61_004840 [Dispira simplex]